MSFLSFFSTIGNGIASAARAVGNGIVSAVKAVGNGVVSAAKTVGKSFSKEGAFTNFVQNYVPLGGLVTAAVHAAAGNKDHAEYAAVKGLSSTVSTAISAVGVLGGPLGVMVASGVAGVSGNLIEGGFKGLMKPAVRNKLDDITLEGVGMSFGAGFASGMLGPAGRKVGATSFGKAVSALATKAGGAVSGAASRAGNTLAAAASTASSRVDRSFNSFVEHGLKIKPSVSGGGPGAFVKARDYVSTKYAELIDRVAPTPFGPRPRPGRADIYQAALQDKAFGAKTFGVAAGKEVANPIAKAIDPTGSLSKLTGAKSNKSSRGPLLATAALVGVGAVAATATIPRCAVNDLPTLPARQALAEPNSAAVPTPSVAAEAATSFDRPPSVQRIATATPQPMPTVSVPVRRVPPKPAIAAPTLAIQPLPTQPLPPVQPALREQPQSPLPPPQQPMMASLRPQQPLPPQQPPVQVMPPRQAVLQQQPLVQQQPPRQPEHAAPPRLPIQPPPYPTAVDSGYRQPSLPYQPQPPLQPSLQAPITSLHPLPPQAPQPMPQATAHNPTTIDFAELGSNAYYGRLQMNGPRRWVATQGGRSEAVHFEETMRQGGLIHLIDHAKGMTVQVNLHSRRISYGYVGSQEQRDVYTIIGTGAR